ncbi:MAG: hypothetical protein PHG25_02240 [Candidatus Pacebacteria bacterium]|nr:hypothetical protein [Candidatus Paceibacterota bacterium]
MATTISKRYSFAALLLVAVVIFFSASQAQATESASASYVVSDSVFGAGHEMDSTSFSITGFLSHILFGSYSSPTLPLSSGTITSCGKITAPGTYTLSSNLNGISGTCFVIAANGVTIDGNGYTVTARGGNVSYAITATSSVANGGSAYSGLTIQNITFTNFAAGINASGNNGTTLGGNGGNIVIASSSLGSLVTSGGTASSGTGGNGGNIGISGSNLDLVGKTIVATRGSGSPAGTSGGITVAGSVLVSSGQVWTGDDSTWAGTRTWSFIGTAYNVGTTTGTTTFSSSGYNAGTVVGDAMFLGYTASSNIVTISGNSNFRGTGKVSGTVFDMLGAQINAWDLVNGSVLTGTLSGSAVFNDTSYTTGTVTQSSTFNDSSYNAGTAQNVIFTASSFNSASGIPNGDPTGISAGHTISGTVTFSTTTSPVIFTVGSGSTWTANTSSWIFATFGQSWNFNFANNTGTLTGDVLFTNSQNNGTINGTSTFRTNSYNAGTAVNASFYDSTYNTGTVNYANFYNTSINSHNSSPGTVTVRCDFYDSSLPGIGSCPVNGTVYHIPYYFNNAVSTNWNTLGNWWFDSSFTQPALVLPQNGDTVYIGARIDTGPTTPVTLGSINVASSTTGGGSFQVNLTGASGPAYFYASSTNVGVVNGVLNIYGPRSLSQVNTTGSYTGDITFHNGSWNDVTIPRNAVFYDTSYNSSGGIVSGNVEFAGANTNAGTIGGIATIDAGASLNGAGTVQGSVSNGGIISGGTFNGVITHINGASLTGSVTNAVSMIFNGGSFVSSSGQVSGDATFNATSSNRGVVSGTATFNGSSYNIGFAFNGVFTGDSSENSQNSTIGIISGTKTRLYTVIAPQTNLFRNFTDSAWTIMADGAYVKLLYSNLIDIAGRAPTTTTTLVEQNGGFILRPLSPNSSIVSCGILDTPNSTYTLGGNISNYTHDICFAVRANGVTIDGNGYSVTGSISTPPEYAVFATSSLSIDATSSAFTNLTIQNIKFLNFNHGLWGRGNDVPNGIGGDGASTTIKRTIIGDIDVAGGDPIEQAGNGGNVFLETSTTTVIVADGGHSTGCGIAGDGGNIFITTDSYLVSFSNMGGQVSGCSSPPPSSYSGSSGSVNTTIVSSATHSASQGSHTTSGYTGSVAGTFSPTNFTSLWIPVNKLAPVTFKSLPTFGDVTGKNTFSLGTGIVDFLFAGLPQEMTSRFTKGLLDLFAQSGFYRAQDIVTLKNNRLTVKDTKGTPGYFSVKNDKGESVATYLAYDAKNTVTEFTKVSPNTRLTISVIPVNEERVTATFNGKNIVFTNNTALITAPARTGKYTLVTSASPLTLTVEVVANTQSFNEQFQKPVSFIKRIFGAVATWFSLLFKRY